MMSKTKIKGRMKKKTNPELVETIELANKNDLLELGKKLSQPTKKHSKVNLDELNELGDNIMIVGKVLGRGDINKKISVSVLNFSDKAEAKLKKAGCEIKTIKQEIEKNPKLKGVTVK